MIDSNPVDLPKLKLLIKNGISAIPVNKKYK